MSLIKQVTDYYAARAPVYDETAGYMNLEAEELRAPIKKRYQKIFAGCDVLEIACGSGYWTSVIAETAKSVMATDINESLIGMAKDRCGHLSNVKFQIADAYTLEGVNSGFNAAFGIWWWSHIPKGQIRSFLSVLHSKLSPGATVLFVDQLPYDGYERRQDSEGNTLEKRTLPDSRSFEIVKNFPTEEEVTEILDGMANDIQFTERPDEKSWSVSYDVR